jgi:hypothetical protein
MDFLAREGSGYSHLGAITKPRSDVVLTLASPGGIEVDRLIFAVIVAVSQYPTITSRSAVASSSCSKNLDDLAAGRKSTYVMAASRGYQKVCEDDYGGYFTQALCDAIEDMNRSVADGKGEITADAAFLHASSIMQQRVAALRSMGLDLEQEAVRCSPGGVPIVIARPLVEQPRESLVVPFQPRKDRCKEVSIVKETQPIPDSYRRTMLEHVRRIWIDDRLKRKVFGGVRIPFRLLRNRP